MGGDIHEEILQVLEQTSSPVLSTSAISEELDYSRQYVDQKLRNLYNENKVKRVKVGPAIGWYKNKNDIQQIQNRIGDTELMDGSIYLCKRCLSDITSTWSDGNQWKNGSWRGEASVALFYTHPDGSHWKFVEAICARHINDDEDKESVSGQRERLTDFFERAIKRGQRDGAWFALVHGRIVPTNPSPRSDDTAVGTLTFKKPTVLDIIPSYDPKIFLPPKE